MTDANGQKFWMLSEPSHWQPLGNPAGTEYDRPRRRLRLADQRLLPLWPNRWSLSITLPAVAASTPQASVPFTFTAQFPTLEASTHPAIAALTPTSPRASDEPTDLLLQISNLGQQRRATVTVGFPDGRYTTRSAVASSEAEPNNTLSLLLILNQPGAWSLRLTFPNGQQSSPYHFTVLSATPAATEITGLESIVETTDFQRLSFTGAGFQPGMTAHLSLPGDTIDLPSGDIQSVTDNSFELFINLHTVATNAAIRLLNQVPQAQDSFGTRARWNLADNRVVAAGAVADSADEIGIYLPPTAHRPTDLTMGHDGILYIALHNPGENTGRVAMVDLRDRWQPFSVPLPPNFVPWRLAAHPEGGIWALNHRDQPSRQLVRIQGEPLPVQARRAYSANTFRPCEENPNPPRAQLLWSGNFADEDIVALATNKQGQLAILSWLSSGSAQLRVWGGDRWQPPFSLEGAQRPFSFKWLAHQQIALLLPGLTTEAVVYALPDPTFNSQSPDIKVLRPTGGFYPLRQYTGEPFLNGITEPPSYPIPHGSQPLHPLSIRTFANSGSAQAIALDSRNVQTVWHRLYLEAVIPPKTGIRLFLAATNDNVAPPPGKNWFEHRFGQRFAPGAVTAGDPAFDRQIPLGAWVSQSSEISYHSGLLNCPIQQNRQGLFTALIQRTGRQVRSLQGRYLWVRAELKGDGHQTPEIAAIRAYASRFSYLNQYLPTLYRESLFGPDADAPGPSTPADFLERFLDNFEGVLTPLEDRIARADLLTDARTVPADSLDWLGSWVGVSLDAAYPPARRRRLLQAAPVLHRQRGTLNGLKHALEIATDGGVSGGEIVVLEDFRLRRTFATILGANLADTTNPLTAGLSVSGNSFVGDTLVLGEAPPNGSVDLNQLSPEERLSDEEKRTFLALFRSNLPLENERDRVAITNFFDKLAHRVTIYVHSEVTPQDLGLIRRIAELESPAHVITRVVSTTEAFLVTLSGLVGLNTYLSPQPPRRTVTLDQSQLGVYDILQQPASLDPRLSGSFKGDLRYPLARADVEGNPVVGESFVLDASRSEAFGGLSLNRYIWTWVDS